MMNIYKLLIERLLKGDKMKILEFLKEKGLDENDIKSVNDQIQASIDKRVVEATDKFKDYDEKTEIIKTYKQKERNNTVNSIAKELKFSNNIVKYAGISDDDDEEAIKNKLTKTNEELKNLYSVETKQPEPVSTNIVVKETEPKKEYRFSKQI